MQQRNPGTEEVIMIQGSVVFFRSNTKELSILSALMWTVKMMEIVIFGAQLRSMNIKKLLKVADIGANAMIIVVDMVS